MTKGKSQNKPSDLFHAGEEDVLCAVDSDKPGFRIWCDALSTRLVAGVNNSCVGEWDDQLKMVRLIQKRGKQFATMGTTVKSEHYLSVEEALWLLDTGSLYMVRKGSGRVGPPSHIVINDKLDSRSAVVSTYNLSGNVAQKRGSQNMEDNSNPDSSLIHKRSRLDEIPPKVDDFKDGCTPSSASSVALGNNDSNISSAGIVESAVMSIDSDLLSKKLDVVVESSSVAVKKKPGPPPGYVHNSGLIANAISKFKPEELMLFEEGYMFLASRVNMDHYLLYSYLRAAAFVVRPHEPLSSYARRPQQETDDNILEGLFVQTFEVDSMPKNVIFDSESAAESETDDSEGENESEEKILPKVLPVYDVYARSGLLPFKPGSPGPPDFFVILQRSAEAPVDPWSLRYTRKYLKDYMRHSLDVQLANSKKRKGSGKGSVLLENSVDSLCPIIKSAILSHTTVTVYAVDEMELRKASEQMKRSRGKRGRRA